jgi:D-glycero-D-manno-heptose 1,7-bisphosphate phosphatase
VAPTTLEDCENLLGADDSVHGLKAAGLVMVDATNQPDVATGLTRREIVNAMHAEILCRLAVDDIKVCFHTDAANCACRKPKPGMLLEAAAECGIYFSASYMVGDRWRDIGAGQAAGCTTIFIDYGYKQDGPCEPDKVVGSFTDATNHVLVHDARRWP